MVSYQLKCKQPKETGENDGETNRTGHPERLFPANMEAESGKIPPVRAVSNRIILSRSAFRIKFITIIICRNNICCYFCFRFTRSEGRKIPLSRPERLFFIKTPRMNRKDFHRPRPAGTAARTETPLPPAGAAETAGGVPSPERNHGTDSYQSTHNN